MRILKMLPLLLVATPVFAQQAQPQEPPKATKADVDRLVSTIKADPAKLRNFCTIVKLQTEIQKADEQKNEQKAKELDQQMEDAAKSLGPDYDRVAGSELDDATSKPLDDLTTSCKV